ncbi:hypothetical protein COY30_00435 [Candidatus Woesebacteria bacterium CG_4_10_14_0_2_um_filter_44_9]|uniref:POTRA domain-containing protein n=2 Tax=Candidatus Woeseibacteriota TaxID=1752722 RepID=A0A2H0BHN7_9BACT|nr:MAG: hypothetical protein COX04_00845 [Candidatus Woesebacteria bacterium CG22_combo_CG10-13_8_21_14_all_45_10]PIZ46335.1 MAG: hypothetical protein COY30_00435 [Candidatus Woesebacteria bacterium CG_4_10_14_0_2_um_filter_44_9]
MKYLNFGLYLLLAFLVFFPFTLFPRVIKIQKIECFSQYGICPDGIFTPAVGAVGKNLLGARIFLADLFKNSGIVEKYGFAFKLPATLRADLVLKRAKFALAQKDISRVVVLDEDGNVLQTLDKTNLPKVVVADGLPAVGERVGEAKLFALNLLYSLNFYYQATYGEIIDSGLVVKMPGGPQVVFPLEGDSETLLGALKLILSGSKSAKLIDLRFKNPIIK